MSTKQKLKQTIFETVYQNPVFVLVLGICPTIGVSTNITDSFFMGLATMFVLICSNTFISLLRNIIPSEVRLPSYILLSATFTTILEIFLIRFMPDFYDSVGGFIKLIVVNCIILARAEAFASKNNPLFSALDGVFIGLGFLGAITLLGAIRQLLTSVLKINIFAMPSGGFIILGCLLATFNFIKGRVKNESN